MVVEDRTRHARLRALLPRVYATDPRGSALGALLDVLADGLRTLDQNSERALRDKWLATAQARRDPASGAPDRIELSGEPQPLEHLGSLLDLLRQPWEVDEQAYRRRIALLGPLMTRGLGTPRTILTFALTALGTEPCPRLDHADDTTTAYGFEARRIARCRACRGGRVMPTEPCPLRNDPAGAEPMTASLVDNPRVLRRLSRTSVPAEGTIHFFNNSLFADRPELELTVSAAVGTHVVPSFRSRQTSERIVVLRVLGPGQTLNILPVSPHDPSEPPHRHEWVDRPTLANPSSPEVRIDGELVDDVQVIVLRGEGFDESRFDVDHFGNEGDVQRFNVAHFDQGYFDYAPIHGTLEVTTPAVVPGVNTWDYVPLGREDVQNAWGRLPPEVPRPDVTEFPIAADLQPVAVRLRWWARPAAHFALRVPPTDAVLDVSAMGAAAYLRQMIERVRPVGVTVDIEFPRPPFRDALDPLDTAVRLTTEGPATGAYDGSLFDFSLLAE